MINFNKKQKNTGFSLLETLLYLSIFSLTAILVINSILVMLSSFREIAVNKDLASGAKILEILSREIRNADSIQIVENQSPFLRSIVLNGTDELGASRVIRIDFENNEILLYEDDGLVGNLNSSNVIVNNLDYEIIDFVREGDYDALETFDPITTTIKIDLELESNRFGFNKIANFSTAILAREGY